VRWCPGCGDYAILKAVQRTLPEIGADPTKTVFVSGIGCSSRFPYYMSTYGFHTIHGRAPAIATGIKLANPDLDVWIITGRRRRAVDRRQPPMHLLRRNIDCQILLFNNEIYGLTKGQYSPTSRDRHALAVDAAGSVDSPVSARAVRARRQRALRGARVRHAQKHLPEVLKPRTRTSGASFVEIFQNCIVYNKDVFDNFTAPKGAEDRQLWLQARRADAVRRWHQGHRDSIARTSASRSSMSWMATGRRRA
jgi:2-oxoglutarate ferredoxin oxidoreductase subunit beta